MSMYSSKSNIQQLVSLLKEFNIKQAVLCPGSRNAPIVQTISAVGCFSCHSVVDERSAGFYAIGVYHATASVVAVCCTSGTALLNLTPAVAEAYYQKIPLVIISADRPQQWIGQMDGQTLPQQGVFNGLVKSEVQLVEGDDDESRWYNNRLINEALNEVSHRGNGPVHINVPVSEPLFEFTDAEFPCERVIRRSSTYPIDIESIIEWNKYNKVLVVCGQMSENTVAYNLGSIASHGIVVFSEILSNDFENKKNIINFDAILSKYSQTECPQELIPDIVFSIGNTIVSKRLKNFLRKYDVTHCIINEDGLIHDTFRNVKYVIEGDTSLCLQALLNLEKKSQAFYQAWKKESEEVKLKSELYFKTLNSELTAMNVVRLAMNRLDTLKALHLGNSMAVRLAQLFVSEFPSYTTCCNRGVNGIEGTLSSAVGYSRCCPGINLVILGDLSFFYDMNVLRHARDLTGLRILLINNGGGGIFHTLTGLNKIPEIDQYIAAGHYTNAQGWAKELGFDYLKVINVDQLEEAMERLFDIDSQHPVIIEAMTDSTLDKFIFNNYYKSLQ